MTARTHNFSGSSSILQASWDDESRELTIMFKSGRSYVYNNVPEDVFTAFTDAPSAGQYFHGHIKDVYS